MLLPEKYESIFDVSSKGPSLGSLINKDGGQENTHFYIMKKSHDKIKTNEMDFNQNNNTSLNTNYYFIILLNYQHKYVNLSYCNIHEGPRNSMLHQ